MANKHRRKDKGLSDEELEELLLAHWALQTFLETALLVAVMAAGALALHLTEQSSTSTLEWTWFEGQ